MIRHIATAPFKGLVLAGLSVLGLVAVLAHALVLVLSLSVGLVILIPWAVGLGRRVTNAWRQLAARWDSVYIPQPYSPAPAAPQPDAEGFFYGDGQLYDSPRMPALSKKIDWMLDDIATWRDLGWLILNATVGNVLALTPAALIVYGALTVPWGALLILIGFLCAPPLLRLHTMGSRALLCPSQGSIRSEPRKRISWGHAAGIFGVSLLGLAALVAVPQARNVANLRRRLATDWSKVPIAESRATRTTWRELLFFALDPVVGVLITVVPFTLLIYAGWGLAIPQTWRWFVPEGGEDWGGGWYGQFAGSDSLAIPVALAMLVLMMWIAPPLVRLNGRWVRFMLTPAKQDLLESRVRQLTETRAHATDAAESELRRIERDLHDGAQARLVAMGIGLSTLEQLIERDPEAAKALLAKVKDTSAQALAELRDLVRGIHPPVLADRGLGDAVRALALDTPLPVTVDVDLPRRLAPPIESAAYFAISEALGNATAHAEANAVDVRVCLKEDVLELTVRDDGRGGADVSRGTGLRGIARRLSAFDGAMTVDSPVGGPTTVRMTVRISAG